jgi:uncharacterized membrane protein
VWVDKFGGDKKTLWVTFLHLGVVVGTVFGYAITGYFITAGSVSLY